MSDVTVRFRPANTEPAGRARNFEARLPAILIHYLNVLGFGTTIHRYPPDTTDNRITALLDVLAERKWHGGGRLMVVKKSVSGNRDGQGYISSPEQGQY